MISEEQIQDLIDSDERYSKEYFIWQMDPDNTNLEQFYLDEIESDIDERVLALMQHTGDMFSDCDRAIDNHEWLVLTDEEADEQVANYAEYSLDDVLYGVNEVIKQYFDTEQYLEDYIYDSDRGSVIASRDGNEYTETVNGTAYYLYNCS
jgi:phosphate uptake regulator